jgi:putative transposase
MLLGTLYLTHKYFIESDLKNLNSLKYKIIFLGIQFMRKLRQLKQGARYHVISRANRKELIMESDHLKELFLLTVRDAKEKYKFKIDNFCIMGNHFHMIIEPLQNENLSVIMKWILGTFAIRWNKIHKITGHVWGDRFFSRIITGFREFVGIFSYIDKNPVEANLVKDETQWEYNAMFHRRKGINYLIDQLPDWLQSLFPNHKLVNVL